MGDDQDGSGFDGGFVIWDRIEAWRTFQAHRTLAIQLGDLHVALAALHVSSARRRPRMFRKAAGLLVKACAQYQAGGLNRRAKACWRYARLVHRAAGRAGL
jgi:hypothetical protein